MTLKDISNGPEWVIWVVFVVFAILSITLLTGHGASLIAGYNRAGKEEKNKYNTKKLCRITGMGMSVLAILILIMAIGYDSLPASFAYVFLAITLLDSSVLLILIHTVCKRRQ